MALITDALQARDAEAEGLAFARDVLRIEARAIDLVRDRLGPVIARAADRVFRCQGLVIVTGMGKAGIVGQKLAATLASTGTRAFPLHPAEAIHGDLGRIRAEDVVIVLSQSGETDEIVRIIPSIRRLGGALIAITGRAESTLGRLADDCIPLGPIDEACPLGLAPSASTTAMMAVGDALALLVSRMRDFRAEDFAWRSSRI
jgi:arabinose-5-phosphate isomerase